MQKDILGGLSQSPKRLSSKYFYDDKGSALFAEIMRLKEYYLTDCEYEIFSTQKQAILDSFSEGVDEFELIEFGAGDGFKTKVLIDHFLNQKAEFVYAPVDISKAAVEELSNALRHKFPALEVEAVHDDYFNALENLNERIKARKIVLFLGANIGNYSETQAIEFLSSIRKNLKPNDLLMVGFDLRKNPKEILGAYNDSFGVTKAFNLNLLDRINRELGANFDRPNFDHYPTYDPVSGEARSYIVSLKEQDVYFESSDTTIHFDQWEFIHTEISKKYSLTEIENLGQKAGFKISKHFLDCKHYFVDTVLSPI